MMETAISCSMTQTFKRCSVCQYFNSIDNLYGAWACQQCKEFFAECVTKRITPFCTVNGECYMLQNNLNECIFCRLNKCYDAGMKAELIEYYCTEFNIDKSYYTKVDLEKRFTLEGRSIIEDFRESARYMEQSYYKWLFSLENYNILPKSSQDKLLDRTALKGTILEYIQRSLHVHDVIRSVRCFFHPNDCHVPFIRQFTECILDFTRLCRYVTPDEKTFFKFKLKLSMGHDVHVAENIPIDLLQEKLENMEKILLHTYNFGYSKIFEEIDDFYINSLRKNSNYLFVRDENSYKISVRQRVSSEFSDDEYASLKSFKSDERSISKNNVSYKINHFREKTSECNLSNKQCLLSQISVKSPSESFAEFSNKRNEKNSHRKVVSNNKIVTFSDETIHDAKKPKFRKEILIKSQLNTVSSKNQLENRKNAQSFQSNSFNFQKSAYYEGLALKLKKEIQLSKNKVSDDGIITSNEKKDSESKEINFNETTLLHGGKNIKNILNTPIKWRMKSILNNVRVISNEKNSNEEKQIVCKKYCTTNSPKTSI